MRIHLMVITDGRPDCLERTLESLDAALEGPIRSRHIIDDSRDERYGNWIRSEYGDRFEIHSFDQKLGFGGAIQKGWSLVPTDAEYVFHMEDDFVFLQQVELIALAATLREHPHLVQVVLKRQPWGEEEKAAGGIIEMWPDEYETFYDAEMDVRWAEHRLFFSTNPCMYRRSLIEQGWPSGEGSEREFTNRQLRDPEARFAFYGDQRDRPRVLHIGRWRAGSGY